MGPSLPELHPLFIWTESIKSSGKRLLSSEISRALVCSQLRQVGVASVVASLQNSAQPGVSRDQPQFLAFTLYAGLVSSLQLNDFTVAGTV